MDTKRLLRELPEEKIFELVERLDVRGPRYTSYPTVPVWKSDFPVKPFVESLRRMAAEKDPIAVYVHLPFCKSRCLYCGCNSCISSDEPRIRRYVTALTTEIERVSGFFQGKVKHGQLHLGGGTPTHIPPTLLAWVLDYLIERIPATAHAEHSVEVDPRVTTDEHLDLLAERGFRRISVGLQDLNADVQFAIRREYTLDQLKEFIARSRRAGFTSVNIDLIYGLPLQTRASWIKTLEEVVKLRPDRIASFGYAHLPEKIKHQRAIKDEDLPPARDRLGMLLDANHFFTDHGYEAVGMDHFALPGDELAMARRGSRLWRNFMGYTTSRGMELLGFGCSAISEFRDLFVQNLSQPEAYADAIAIGTWAVQRGHKLDEEDRLRKQIINHLMCNLEIDVPDEAHATGNGLVQSLEGALESLKQYEADGLLVSRNGGFTITDLGQLFVRNLAMPFDRYLEGQTDVKFSRTV
ncbi:MAG TPA: oxygen-independent coproporphyrinogen III oxidase [bacterium]|jgi:oxygen-independent coproporphyrinogen-3 oxidase